MRLNQGGNMKIIARKPRIALMTSTIDGRRAKGTATVARKCVEALLERRNEFDLTFIHYEKTDDLIYHHGVREVIFPRFRWSFLNRRSLRFIYYFFTTKDEFEIIHWFQPRLYPFFWLARAKHIVVTVHGAGDFSKESKFDFMRHTYNWTLKLFRKKVAVAIAISDYAKKDIMKHYGFADKQMRVICNGVDSSFSPARREAIAAVKKKYGLPDVFFLGVGRLVPVKNVPRMLMAFEQFFSSSLRKDIHFANIGASGPEKPLVDAILNKSPFKGRMQLVHYVDQEDLPAVYSAALALVFPILNEGFGLPIMEAMACGTPVIASKTAFPEIKADEAILVDVLSQKEIANAMRAIADDSELRRNLIQKGFAKVATLTWKETGNKLIAVYKELLRDANKNASLLRRQNS